MLGGSALRKNDIFENYIRVYSLEFLGRVLKDFGIDQAF